MEENQEEVKIHGRFTVYNNITSPELMKKVNKKNIDLEKDFLDYLASTGKSKGTIKQYRANMHIFWCWSYENIDNRFFVELRKRDYLKFQRNAIEEWGWSPRRIKVVKATLSSLSNYITNFLDDEFPDYKSVVDKIESPADMAVREKTILTEEDVERVLKILVERKEYDKACFLALALNCGKRRSEIPRFKTGYFRDEYVICNGAMYKTPEKITTKGRGVNGKLLYAYTLKSAFDPYLKLWLEERERLGIFSQWLFPKCVRGKYLNDEKISDSKLSEWACYLSGLFEKPFYWHCIRHYLCTKLISYGIPSKTIKDFYGWDSAAMVDIYDDNPKEQSFDSFFSVDGIKKMSKSTTLETL